MKSNELIRLYENLFKTDGMHYNSQEATDCLRTIKTACPHEKLIFSNESGLGTILSYPDVFAKAERIRQIFGSDVRILIGFREQRAVLLSQYRDHPFDPNNVSYGRPVSFHKWIKLIEAKRYMRFTDAILYDRVIAHYDRLFGMENVLALPVELLNTNPNLYLSLIEDFVGVKMEGNLKNSRFEKLNIGKSKYNNRYRRLRRLVFPNIQFRKAFPAIDKILNFNAFVSSQPEKIQIEQELEHQLSDRYTMSNNMLEQRVKFNLRQLGYLV